MAASVFIFNCPKTLFDYYFFGGGIGIHDFNVRDEKYPPKSWFIRNNRSENSLSWKKRKEIGIGKYGDDNHDILGPGMTYWDQRWYDNSLKSYSWYIGPGMTDESLEF